VLECVVNLSEGTDRARIDAFREIVGGVLLDTHVDRFHNRAVLTLAGEPGPLEAALADLTRLAVATLDLRRHVGVHPRLGVVDVVPFVDLDEPWAPSTATSVGARGRYAEWVAAELDLPCFLYGPERDLPDVRRAAWKALLPDTGPSHPHPTAGAVCVGVRGVLVAYNLMLSVADLDLARTVAASVRRPGLRTLGLVVGSRVQVSCNLTDPVHLGPADAYDLVALALERQGPKAGCIGATELVGLLPAAVLASVPARRWTELDVGPDRTIEARLARVRPE
jgi:glutamate formiminotransferase